MTIMAQNLGLIESSARLLSKKPPEKEIIHSGHFMVSNFEADAQDDEDVYINTTEAVKCESSPIGIILNPAQHSNNTICVVQNTKSSQNISIETSLTKLFKCMSLAYRQKLTSPKWNRFKGIRLRWKDKIRLNNVIWRCWHMQFINKKNALVCQFASPLDTDTHNKPEAIVLEGKYWKRKLNAVTAEYKKWRLFYRNRLMGSKDGQDQDMMSELERLEWQPQADDSYMMVDEDYMALMTDTLFSTISANQPFAFPDTREIVDEPRSRDTFLPQQFLWMPCTPRQSSTTSFVSRLISFLTFLCRSARGAGLADFIQPSLVQLQPNLDDFMDTLEPLHELLYSRLPPVPEETQTTADSLYRSLTPSSYLDSKRDLAASYQSQSQPQFNFPAYASNQVQQKSRQQQNYPLYSLSPYQQLSPPAHPGSPSPPQQEYVLPHASPTPVPLSAVYRAAPQTIRSNSLPLGSTLSRREEEVFAIPKLKMFSRSRSGSCLSANSKPPPPLVSAVSEPQLTVPAQNSSALLAHLLNTNSTNSQTYSGPQNAVYSSNDALKLSGSMPSLDTYYKQTERQTERSSHRSVIYSTQTDNGSLNLSANRSIVENRLAQQQQQSLEPAFTFTAGKNRKHKSPVSILPHTASSNMLLPAQQPSTSQMVSGASAGSSPKHPDSPGTSECLSLSPLNVGSPHSPGTGTVTVYKEQRRVSHINAEQKRRCNIKNGFDTLHSLIPQLSQNPNAKLSKAAMLNKGADYIRQLRSDRQTLKEEIENLKQQVESLNSAISNCQAMLPATGAPVSRQRSNKMREMYDEYVRVRTQENWKFWILSLLCEPLLASFNAQVSTHSLNDLYRTTLNWVDHHCTLTVLRPLVLNALRQLCTTTDILSNPDRLQAEARAAANKGGRHGSS